MVVPVWKAGGGWKALGFEFSVFRCKESEPVRWQAPPRKRTGVREHAGIRVLRSPPMATTQLVDGACLISRYCAVRSRGGQLRRDSSVGLERPAHNGEAEGSVPSLATEVCSYSSGPLAQLGEQPTFNRTVSGFKSLAAHENMCLIPPAAAMRAAAAAATTDRANSRGMCSCVIATATPSMVSSAVARTGVS